MDSHAHATDNNKNLENKDNLLLCVGFIGKLQINSSNRTKLDSNKNLEIFGRRGISVLKAKKADMYTHYNGDQTVRFSVYKPSREEQYEDDLEE